MSNETITILGWKCKKLKEAINGRKTDNA